MDYINGYKDAVGKFENTINKVVKEFTRGTPKDNRDYQKALDSVIATLYVAKLQGDRMEDEYLADMEEFMADDYNHDLEYDGEDLLGELEDNPLLNEDCDNCPSEGFCRAINDGKTLKEIAIEELMATK